MSLAQNFANAIRIRTGQKPLVVTTSIGSGEYETSSPLAEWITKRDSTRTETLSTRFIAKAAEGLRKPENQLWNITAKIDDGRFNETVASGITYDRMMAFMKAREITFAREAGITGTADEIVAKRKDVVAKNNVLRFAK